MGNELARSSSVTGLQTVRDEADQNYGLAQRAASLCREIVKKTAVRISGRDYVPIEGWQAIATAHGCVLSSRDVESVPLGWRAIGEVRRMSDGAVLASAEGFLGRDEPVWCGGKVGTKEYPARPEYACRAMTQTRAMSRAGRSAFAHVVVLMDSSLQTTPAEEMDGVVIDAPLKEPRATTSAAPQDDGSGDGTVTTTVVDVMVKKGTNPKTGKEYARYTVTTDAGAFTTFDEKVATFAKERKGQQTTIHFATSKFGRDIESIQ